MHALHMEGCQSSAIGLLIGRWTKDAQPIDALQPLKQMPGEVLLPGVDAIQANRLEVVEGSAHADRLADGRSAGLKFVRKPCPGAVVQVHVLDHFAAP